MGQTQSSTMSTTWTHKQMSTAMGTKLYKLLEHIEQWCIKDNVKSISSKNEDMTTVISKESFLEFLQLPPSSSIGPILYHAVLFMGNYPYIQPRPYNLDDSTFSFECLVKAVIIFTGRIKLIAHDSIILEKLIFSAFAESDNYETLEPTTNKEEDSKKINSDYNYNSIDWEIIEQDETIIQCVFGSIPWKECDLIKNYNGIDFNDLYIRGDFFLEILSFILLISQLKKSENLKNYIEDKSIDLTEIIKFKKTSMNLLKSFNNDFTNDNISDFKIRYFEFKLIIDSSMPYLFNPLYILFERFLFSDNLTNKKHSTIEGHDHQQQSQVTTESEGEGSTTHLKNETNLINNQTLSQLATIFPSETIFQNLKKLYVGSEYGYSMRSFENKVFKWNAPTILLISGKRLTKNENLKKNGQRSFESKFSKLRNNNSLKGHSMVGEKLKFGVYLNCPWKSSNKQCFGDSKTKLFQLEPHQDIFPASSAGKNFAYFVRSGGGIGFGSPPPSVIGGKKMIFAPGNVSLTIDESFEYGIFRHAGIGGTFRSSNLPINAKVSEYDDIFSVTDIEVWGCGGDDELNEQLKQWEWEEREAKMRSSINTKNLGEERAFLEMAGLVGNHGASGGSC